MQNTNCKIYNTKYIIQNTLLLQHKYHTKIDEQIEKISGQMSKDVVGKLVQVMMMVMMMMMVMVVLLIKMIKALDFCNNVGTGDGQNPVQAGDL